MLEFILYAVTVAAIYGLATLSLNLQVGVSGLLNFGQVAFFGVGAYATGIVALHGGSWLLGIAAGIVVASLLGLAIGRLGRTLAADYWAIVTLALAECIRLIANNQSDLTGGPQGISGIPGPFPALSGESLAIAWLVLAVGVTAAAYVVSRTLTNMQFGRVMRLIREEPLQAQSLGHDVTRMKMKLLAVAAPMAATGGSLYTLYLSYIGPNQLMPVETFLVFTMLIAGGVGNHRGALFGALLVNLIYLGSRFLKDFLPIPDQSAGSIRVLIVGLLITAFLLIKPDGLMPERLRRIHAER